MRNQTSNPYRPAYRVKLSARHRARLSYHAAARLREGTRFWSRPPNPARLLCTLVRQILKFHKSDPLLNPLQR